MKRFTIVIGILALLLAGMAVPAQAQWTQWEGTGHGSGQCDNIWGGWEGLFDPEVTGYAFNGWIGAPDIGNDMHGDVYDESGDTLYYVSGEWYIRSNFMGYWLGAFNTNTGIMTGTWTTAPTAWCTGTLEGERI